VELSVSGPNQLRLSGLAAGETTVAVWAGSRGPVTYAVKVTSTLGKVTRTVRKRTLDERKAIVDTINGMVGDASLRAREGREMIFLDGQVFNMDDQRLVEQILRRFPDVKNFTRSSLSHVTRSMQVNKALQQAGIIGLTADCHYDSCVLEGASEGERSRAEEIVQRLLRESAYPP
jgi:hypothetical protein